MDQPLSGQSMSEKGSSRRLDSWKEIAAYFNRDATTVQRWEKREGMPVHRHVHDRSGSVYAFPEELAAWLQSRKSRLEEEEKEPVAQTPVDTPTGDEVDRRMPAFSPRIRRWIAASGVILLALLAVAYALTRSRAGDVSRTQIRSLAVLPLKDLSGDPTQEYLADGMTEALIGSLSTIHNLRVISRTSVMRFKDTQLSVPEIAKTLHVDAIVEGSVIREGNRIRIHAQLIRAATDEHFWSEGYDRELRDVLSLQSDVAQVAAQAAELSGKPERTIIGAMRNILELKAPSSFWPFGEPAVVGCPAHPNSIVKEPADGS